MDAERHALTAESRALVAALARFRTRRECLASPEGAGLQERLARHLVFVRRFEPASVPAGALSVTRDWIHAVHWNILHGQQYDRILHALRTEPALAGADLVSLNEVDLGLARSGNRDVAFDLARELGLHAAWTPLFLELAAGHRTPPMIAVQEQRESFFGLALLSRWPLGEVRRVALVSPEDLLFDRERKAGRFVALVAEVRRPGSPFHLVVTHLDVHGSPADRLTQMGEILEAVPASRAILAGDLNTTTFARGGWTRAARTLAMLALAPRPTLRRRLLAPHEPLGAAREPLFDALCAQGFAHIPFNDATESLDLHLADVHELDFMPAPLRRATLAMLHGVEHRNTLRLDWIAARGFRPAPERTPFALPHLMRRAPAASDHAPVGCGLRQA